MEDKDQDDDWNRIRRSRSERRQPKEPVNSSNVRFGIAMAILLVAALIYPWYLHWVDSIVATWRFQAFSEDMEKSAEEFQTGLRKQTAISAETSRREQLRKRIALVNVRGVTAGVEGLVVVVDLGAASLTESSETICRQAGASLRRSLAGTSLKVQRYRLNQPALDAGIVNCR